MAKKKFNIGDHVVIKESNIEFLETFRGKTGVVKQRDDFGTGYDYLISVDNRPCLDIWCDVKCLVDDVKTFDKIVITTDGKTTTATRYREDGTKDSATANCAPEDEFDFAIGSQLALERLNTKPNNTPCEHYVNGFKVGDRVKVGAFTGTIICISVTDLFGVQFDDEDFAGHTCRGVALKAGKPGDKTNCWWVDPVMVVMYRAPKSVKPNRRTS